MKKVTEKVQAIDFKKIQFPYKQLLQLSKNNDPQLSVYQYPTQNNPKGAILFFHGYQSYAAKSAYVAEFFAKNGYQVFSYDYRGFGDSEGPAFILANPKDFIQDGQNFVHWVQQEIEHQYASQTIPLIGYGYLTGGALSITLQKELSCFNSLILCSPFIGLNGMTPLKSVMISLLGRFFPNIKLQDFKRLPGEHLDIFYADNKQYQGPLLAQSMATMLYMLKINNLYAPQINIPTHLSYGIRDNVINFSKVNEYVGSQDSKSQHIVQSYDTDHYSLSDGLVYEDILNEQLKWLDSIFGKDQSK